MWVCWYTANDWTEICYRYILSFSFLPVGVRLRVLSVSFKCVSPPKHKSLVPTGMCQMTEQRAVERNALIHPGTAATIAYRTLPRLFNLSSSSDVTFINSIEATKHGTNSILIMFFTWRGWMACQSSPCRVNKQWHNTVLNPTSFISGPHIQKACGRVFVLHSSHISHSVTVCFDRMTLLKQSHRVCWLGYWQTV